MKVAREGVIFIVIAWLLALGALYMGASRQSLGWYIAAVPLLIIALWVVYFFRDPERTGDRGEHLVVSPADGLVVMVTDVVEPSFIAGAATRISIFMNVFDVHVNRYPVNGIVKYLQYNKGLFLHAAHEKASLDNEQMSVGIESGSRKILVRQIAGLIARRIVNYARTGDKAEQGVRMGIIRFGSRVDVFIPPGSSVRIKVGERTVAGTTVLAELAP
ncbi:MAG: Phosphatidylserine decarboxylase proenzyme [Gemmatimonadetes bacterium]|jgi:phosphatidylserine decarboxylase|nr:Phosphatidylserine decarboxylase proenzyme [Gemmatimonadota bacterium]